MIGEQLLPHEQVSEGRRAGRRVGKLLCFLFGHKRTLTEFQPRRRYFATGIDCGRCVARELKAPFPKGWRWWMCPRCGKVVDGGRT
jgi:hypothetical protein